MEVTLTVEPIHAECPACRTAMTRLATLHGIVAGCTACGGIWIDHVFGQKVLMASISEHVKGSIARNARSHWLRSDATRS